MYILTFNINYVITKCGVGGISSDKNDTSKLFSDDDDVQTFIWLRLENIRRTTQ